MAITGRIARSSRIWRGGRTLDEGRATVGALIVSGTERARLGERLPLGLIEGTQSSNPFELERLMKGIVAGTLALAALLAVPAAAQDDMMTAKAVMKGVDGAEVGTVTFTETPAGVLIQADLTGLPPGVHGFHLHETGSCEPDFGAAGGHYNPTAAEHGFLVVGGPHAGDMPNIHVPESGVLGIEVLNANVSLEEGVPETLFDEDGTSLMIHADADDYKSPPSGDAGARNACGVVER